MTPSDRRCQSRHRKCWIISRIGVTHLLWCYECGAIRNVPRDKRWTYPVGPEGTNPALTGRPS